ncbi:MAG TPA: hypothetical protein VFG46_31620 [Chryseolinea sp.]|nr:hypothetical protein [Chryseolinea sp.]
MDSKTSELPIIKKIKILPSRKNVAPDSSCCTPKDDAVCCTPSKSQEENNGSCCPQPKDGSDCCNK